MGLMPVGVRLFGVLDPGEVSTSYQGKAEMGWLLLFLGFVALGFWLTRMEVRYDRYRALPPRR